MKIYFDENTSLYIAKAIDVLETKNEISVFHTKEEFGQGEDDEVIVKKVHDNKGVLFSQDDDFKKAQEVVEAMKRYPIGFFISNSQRKLHTGILLGFI